MFYMVTGSGLPGLFHLSGTEIKIMKKNIRMLFSIIAGNLLIAFAVSAFVIPHGMMQGGTTGLALTVRCLMPHEMRLSVISLIINGLLFLIGLAVLGWKFSAASLASTIIFPSMLRFFEDHPVDSLFMNEELTIVALCCGLMIGCGIGLIIRAGGSSGGMDIMACILWKKKGIPVGTSLLFFDAFIIMAQVLCMGMDGILASILVICVTSLSVNYFTVLGKKKVEIMIISPEYEEIRHQILSIVDCGLTMLDVETGYLGLNQKALISVVYASKYKEIREVVLKCDNKAFIVVNNVREVRGRGYTMGRYN